MIEETTWNKQAERRTNFMWRATPVGLELTHENGNPPYIIPWNILHSILLHAMEMASENNNVIIAGIHQSEPTPGSLGEWVLSQDFVLSPGALTPRHLSFLGPIFGRMGFINCQYNGNSIQWVFNR